MDWFYNSTSYAMKKVRQISCPRLLCLILLTVYLSTGSALFAGDVKIKGYIADRWAVANQPYKVEVTFNNDEAYDVYDFSVNYSIYKMTGPLDWELSYEYKKEQMTVPAGSELTINNDDMPWIPDLLGRFQLRITTTASNDINPDNDDMEVDLGVNRFIRLGIKQFDMVNPDFGMKSSWGWVSFKIPAKTDFSFYNLKARNPLTDDQAWIVKNIEIPPVTDDYFTRIGTRFKFSDLGFVLGEKIETVDIIVQESETPLEDFSIDYGWLNNRVRPGEFKIGVKLQFHKKHATVNSVNEVPVINATGELTYVSIINEMVGDDLNNEAHPPTDVYAGDFGANAPYAASLGFHWLDSIAEEVDLGTEVTVRETMEALSGMMSRADGASVTSQQVIEAKLQFIDQEKIPVAVGFQSVWLDEEFIDSPIPDYSHQAANEQAGETGVPPSWEYIYSGMDQGCAVEILVGWHDDQGETMEGFWVPVVGVSQTDSTRSITIREDCNESDTAQAILNTFHHYQVDNGWGWLSGFDDPPWKAYIESVITQCPDTSVTFEIDNFSGGFHADSPRLVIHNNPGPVSAEILLTFRLDEESDVEVFLYNIHGQLIDSHHVPNTVPGDQEFIIPPGVIRSSGTYLVVVKTGRDVRVSKLVRE